MSRESKASQEEERRRRRREGELDSVDLLHEHRSGGIVSCFVAEAKEDLGGEEVRVYDREKRRNHRQNL
jgi:hypothetical protein